MTRERRREMSDWSGHKSGGEAKEGMEEDGPHT
jgi:hypothetical protein